MSDLTPQQRKMLHELAESPRWYGELGIRKKTAYSLMMRNMVKFMPKLEGTMVVLSRVGEMYVRTHA